ncbi:hypothetical protein LNV09_10160 [Paucibacter sp. B2R-40]|uniref:hypothetical protein n=1 Tax=Paucibacter sp. B2R-40 TaxID=2893554 RepID=UPI0021E38548|nr:hypothetical protein [Paucibacter sp. B2R-40]MCV2354526.1 hypothetical protein [Paucibacter sp. B2R-40]
MKNKFTLNTSADSKYFSRALNLIGSVRYQSRVPPNIRVWDLGLTRLQRLIFRTLLVEVSEIQKFAPWWNICYSWKMYVYHAAPEQIFLHLDAGNTILGDIASVYETIEYDNYFLIDQGQTIRTISPDDLVEKFNPKADLTKLAFAAGNIGLNKGDSRVASAISEAYIAAAEGYCLGFSEVEKYKYNQGFSKVLRKCDVFRHDQTVFNLIFTKYYPNSKLHDHQQYAAVKNRPGTLIFNQRTYSYRYILNVCDKKISLLILGYCLITDTFQRATRKLKWKLRNKDAPTHLK